LEVAVNEHGNFSWETGPGHHRPTRLAGLSKEKPSTRKMIANGFSTRKERRSAMIYWLTGGRLGSELTPEYQEQLTKALIVWWTSNVLAALDVYTAIGHYIKRFFSRR